MTPAERWAAVRALAEAALDCPLAERDAVLDGSCGGDRALRDEAARLVLACERAKADTGFLTCHAAERAAPLLATMLPPDTAVEASASAGIPEALRDALANDYLLERELGRGGMATVYLAQDRQHGRPVAVKVLTPELRASVSVERFLAEIRVTPVSPTRISCRSMLRAKREAPSTT
jgi:eukaryotic-like serine/threonine-protein kinase